MEKTKNEELGRKSVEEFKSSSKTPVIIVLDNVRSALNVGSVFRTADAFLVEAIYLCGITAQPPDKEIQKTALGATESVAWKHFGNTMEAVHFLKQNGYKVYAVEQAKGSISLDQFETKNNIPAALVFGHEVKGVEQEVISACDGCIEIPQSGTKHSLNISVSVGVVVWELYRQQKQEPGDSVH